MRDETEFGGHLALEIHKNNPADGRSEHLFLEAQQGHHAPASKSQTRRKAAGERARTTHAVHRGVRSLATPIGSGAAEPGTDIECDPFMRSPGEIASSQEEAGGGQCGDDAQREHPSPAKVRKARAKRGPAGHTPRESQTGHADRAEELSGGQYMSDAQNMPPAAQADCAGHLVHDDQWVIPGAETEVEQPHDDRHSIIVDFGLIVDISALWRQRRFWVKQEVKLGNAMFAYCLGLLGGCNQVAKDDVVGLKANENRKAEARVLMAAALGKGEHPRMAQAAAGIMPIAAARTSIENDRKAPDKRLAKLARQLPVAPWFEAVYGVAIGSLAAIVGEAGDLSNYANPQKLWKRFGLMPIGGKSCATWKSKGGLSGEDWTRAGYNPQRRSVMWNIGNGLIGGMGNGPRPLEGEATADHPTWTRYQKLFVDELRAIVARKPEHARPLTKDGKESFSKHAAAMAKRVVEKQFLVDLWVEWSGLVFDLKPIENIAPSSPSDIMEAA